jgi:ornithine decarboxylase
MSRQSVPIPPSISNSLSTVNAVDTIAQSEQLPPLEIDDLLYSQDIGAHSNASSTWFNGFPPAKVVHVNQ